MRYLLLPLLLIFIACQPAATDSDAVIQQEQIEKIDFHSHYRYPQPFLEPLLDKWHMRAQLVEVCKDDSTGIHRYWKEISAHAAASPDRFFLCTGFNAHGIDEPDFAASTIQRLESEIAAGARMVKVWKNIGMVDKDASGAYVQIDDPRLQPIWDFLVAKGIPVLAHIGEPLQAWIPLQEDNPHYNYFSTHPQYHAYLHPEIPRYETIIAARDNWLANNPDLIVVGAHMGSMSHDVDMIAERLDRFPNFHVEPAARFGDITGQDSEKVRAFFLKYQDRILYGTDLGTSAPASEVTAAAMEQRKQEIEKMISLHWAYFSGTDTLYFDSPMISFPVHTHSLALPTDVLQKLYAGNARRILQLP